MSEWFFMQSMKRNEKDMQLEDIRKQIKEAGKLCNDLEVKLSVIADSKKKLHPLRFEFIAARSKYWDLVAEMRDIEYSKSVTPEER